MLQRLIYVSRSRIGADREALRQILTHSQYRNAASDITGVLWAADEGFAQVLEGPSPAVTETWKRIRNDVRHTDIAILEDRAIISRQFGSWSMKRGGDQASDFATIFIVGVSMNMGISKAKRLYDIVMAAAG